MTAPACAVVLLVPSSVRNTVEPGQRVDGQVRFEEALAGAEVVVHWSVQGAANVEPTVVHVVSIVEPIEAGYVHPLRFRMPLVPMSYRGKHFEIQWEVVVRVRTPDGTEIVERTPFEVAQRA